MNTLNINGSPWLFSTTPIRFIVNGEPADFLVDYTERSVLVCTVDGTEAAAIAAAEAIASITTYAERPQPPRLEVAPCRRVVRFSGCFVTGLTYPPQLDAPWDRLEVRKSPGAAPLPSRVVQYAVVCATSTGGVMLTIELATR